MPDVKANLARSGAEPVPSTPQAFGARIASEIEKWRKVVKETGLRLE
jgi:tripartite-type tricarboxylate transporter receptor subunit TctC